MAQFTLSQLLDADFRDFDLDGHRRQPPPGRHRHARSTATTASRACATLLADTETRGDEPVHMPAGLGHEQHSFGGELHASATSSPPTA